MRKKKRKWPKLVATILVTALLAGAVSLVLVEKFAPEQTYIPQSLVELPSKFVAAALKPFQGVFSWATRTVTNYLATTKLQKNIYIEYNKIKQQNEEWMIQALRAEELEAENQRLNALWEVSISKEYKELNPVMAKVTAKETGMWFQAFTIDVGRKHGVEEYMAVVNADGLIGYVQTVHETTSEVLSIIDSRASIAALIQSSRDQGEIKGTLGLEEEATCRMYYLPVDLSPRPNDPVVTSGIGMPFPKGIKIGVVRESTRYLDQNKHYVVIEPYVDFMHIEEVLVLIYKAAPEDVPDADDGQIQYTFQVLDTARPVPIIGDQLVDPLLGAVTPPPRPSREPVEGMEIIAPNHTPFPTGNPNFTLAPGASPTPNPELDAEMWDEMQQELEAQQARVDAQVQGGD